MESLLYLLKSTTILSLFILVYEFFLKKETLYKHHRIFFLLGVFIAAVLPYFSIEKWVIIAEYVETKASPASIEYTLTSYDILTEGPGKISFWKSLNYVQILSAIYLSVTAFFLMKFSVSLWQLKSFLRNEKRYISKGGIKYIQTKENTGPFSFFRNIVYNPNLHSDNEIKLILKHEEAHVKNYHSVDALLANLLVFTNWFNPLAWLYRKRITQNLEFLADAEATLNLNCPKAYQLSLLNYVKIDSSHLPVNNFHKSFIHTRIRKLHQSKSHKNASLKTGVILPLLITFFLVFQVNSQEEVRYIEVHATPLTLENELISENKITVFVEEKTAESNFNISKESSRLTAESDFIKQSDTTTSLKVFIAKTTTEASLKNIKKLLSRNGIQFAYSSLKYDKNNYLTQIDMSFTDNKGKDYHYSILGNKPILEVELIVSDDFTGFRTFTNFDQTQSIDRNSAIILNGKSSLELDKELREILLAAEKRAGKSQEDVIEAIENNANTVSYIKSINIIKNTSRGQDASAIMIINDENEINNSRGNRKNNVWLIDNKRDSLMLIHNNRVRLLEDKKDSLLLIHNSRVQLIEKERDSLRLIRARTTKEKDSYDAVVFMIEKHTPDHEFEYIKTFLASHNIDFTFSVKRNKKGEITKLKVKSSDQNGKTTTTSYENNQGISSFQLGLKGSEFFLKS